MLLVSARMYFSYSSFFVYDDALGTTSACLWTEVLSRQGFARRERQVQFSTLLEFGYADLKVHLGPYQVKPEYRRAIEVPIEVASRRVIVLGGPDDLPGRRLTLGVRPHYRLVAAQAAGDGEDHEAIDLYFEELSAPLTMSRIILADAALVPPNPLLETVDGSERQEARLMRCTA